MRVLNSAAWAVIKWAKGCDRIKVVAAPVSVTTRHLGG
jgi:hypothetical protein